MNQLNPFCQVFLMFILLISTNTSAKNVKIKFTQKSFHFFEEEDLKIEQIQAKLRCHFIHQTRGNNKISSRYPLSRISYTNNNLILKINKSSLTEFMPNFDLINCAYSLVVLGRNTAGKLISGDIALLGELKTQMSENELSFIQNEKVSNEYLNKKLNGIIFGIRQINTKMKIIEIL